MAVRSSLKMILTPAALAYKSLSPVKKRRWGDGCGVWGEKKSVKFSGQLYKIENFLVITVEKE
jgi:hypothetical protein